ncbi:hypothetical protein T484DRAFT_1806256, partial [Baffinella frigidus]
DSTGPGVCTVCPAGSYSAEIGGGSAGVCETCPDNSDSEKGSSTQDDCICDAGYFGSDGGPCVSCSAGTYKYTNGTGACIKCPTDTYSTTAPQP